jgi:hypothetical protein
MRFGQTWSYVIGFDSFGVLAGDAFCWSISLLRRIMRHLPCKLSIKNAHSALTASRSLQVAESRFHEWDKQAS